MRTLFISFGFALFACYLLLASFQHRPHTACDKWFYFIWEINLKFGVRTRTQHQYEIEIHRLVVHLQSASHFMEQLGFEENKFNQQASRKEHSFVWNDDFTQKQKKNTTKNVAQTSSNGIKNYNLSFILVTISVFRSSS